MIVTLMVVRCTQMPVDALVDLFREHDTPGAKDLLAARQPSIQQRAWFVLYARESD